MKEAEDRYLNRLAFLERLDNEKQLSAVFVSSVTGKPVQSAAEFGPDYWCRNFTSPVLFYSAVSTILASGLSNPTFIEVGPHSALSGALHDIASETGPVPYIPILVRGTHAYASVLRTAGRLFQSTSVELSTLCRGATLGDLPPYQWQYDGRFWSESRVSRNSRFRQFPHHDILGSKIPDGNDTEPLWRSLVYLENVPWLRDHVVDDKIVFPRGSYIPMVGEAIRQLTGDNDFSLRHVTFIEEPTLHDSQPMEILTQFRPSPTSEWYDFTITSQFEGTWTKLCTGQARGGRHFPQDITCLTPGPRKVKAEALNRSTKRAGANYGPRFRVMDQISTSVTAPEATAEVMDVREKMDSNYTIHPCTVSSILQLFNVAKAEGRSFNRLAVPTYIGELYVRSSSGPIAVQSTVTDTKGGTFFGDTAGFCDSELVFAFRRVGLSQTEKRNDRGPDPHAGARLVWQPDIDQVDVNGLIRPTPGMSDSLALVEELALACIIESGKQSCSDLSAPHYTKYHQWLSQQRQRAEQGEYESVSSCKDVASMTSLDRTRHIDRLHERALQTNGGHVATAIMRIYHETGAIFNGHADSLSLLMKDNLLTAVYGFKLCEFGDFFRVLSHNRPCMRVLEIGAGTGGVTATILRAMHGPHNERLYERYVYTDISPGFFDGAQERFSVYDGIDYRPLDITADVSAQGFDASYDLIIASNVLHATPNLQQTLSNVKSLLRPNGKLFLQELAPVTKWINYIMGTLPGWWLSTDNRSWEPYVSPERWDAELRAAGFTGTDSVVHDGHMNAHIISSVLENPVETRRRVTVLYERTSDDLNLFVSILRARGFTVDLRHLGDELPADQAVISLLELESPQLHLLSESKYLDLRNMILSLEKTPMLWVTRPSQVGCSDPRYAATLGLLRTARRELGVTIATLELDSLDEKAFQVASLVVDRVLHLGTDSSFDPVLEYIYTQETLMVGKFYPAVVSEELLEIKKPGAEKADAAVLQIGNPERVETLHWERKPVERFTSLQDWVEVQTHAVGISSIDLKVADGTRDSPFGEGYAGIVQCVGPGVRNLRVGDRVMVLAAGSGALATRFVASERLCTRMARGLSWAEAATIPYAFATAMYSLIDVARLKSGGVRALNPTSNAAKLIFPGHPHSLRL